MKFKFYFFVSLCINCFLGSYIHYLLPEQVIYETKSTEYKYVPHELSDWEIFTMALIKTESEYDSTAVSSAGAKGYFQITPIYVKEVNQKHNTNYSMKDVTNFKSAYEIFDLMQQAHNKNYDIKKAIQLHNGTHDWYNNRVMKAYKEIKKYEEVRNMLIDIEFEKGKI